MHKTVNVLEKLPEGQQGRGKKQIHDIYLAASRKEADAAFDLFVSTYSLKYPKAAECLARDRDELLAFYNYPAEHWLHLRITNPIVSTFATVRLRHKRTKGCGSREALLAMVLMLARQAEKHWRRLNGCEVLVHVIAGTKFQDGIMVQDAAA